MRRTGSAPPDWTFAGWGYWDGVHGVSSICLYHSDFPFTERALEHLHGRSEISSSSKRVSETALRSETVCYVWLREIERDTSGDWVIS